MVTPLERIERATTGVERRAAYLDAMLVTPLDAVADIGEVRAAYHASQRPPSPPPVPHTSEDLPASNDARERPSSPWRYLGWLLAAVVLFRIIRMALGS